MTRLFVTLGVLVVALFAASLVVGRRRSGRSRGCAGWSSAATARCRW